MQSDAETQDTPLSPLLLVAGLTLGLGTTDQVRPWALAGIGAAAAASAVEGMTIMTPATVAAASRNFPYPIRLIFVSQARPMIGSINRALGRPGKYMHERL
jgi:hypothetical protein